jgi:dipeptidyl aminopeptidase/acylaminoacyl peptidase
MRFALPLLVCTAAVWGQTFPTLEQLFTRPYAWGTSPSNVRWAKKAPVLLFLWNSEGRRFRDLYAYHASSKKLVRLTDLESDKDELNVSEEQRDDRLRRYLAPPPGLADFDVSNDGRRAAFSYKGDLYFVSTDSSPSLLRLTRTKPNESAPAFSPNGELLASMRGGQVVVQNLANGQIWQASEIEGGSLSSFEWSPDGKTFVCVVSKGARREVPLPNFSGRVVTARPFNRSMAGDEPEEQTILLVPADGGTAKTVDRGGDRAEINDLRWSPDGKRIVLAHFPPGFKKRQIAIIETATAKSRVIFEESDARWVDYGFAGWSPDSQRVFFTSEKDGFAHLYKISAAEEKSAPVQITRGPWEIREEPFSGPPEWKGDWIYFSSTEEGPSQRQFYRIHPDGSGKEKLSSTPGLHIGNVSDDGRFTAVRRADETNPIDLWVNNERVTKSPRPEFSKYSWPKVHYVQFPSRGDKKPVAAKLMLPPGYNLNDKSQKPRPAIVYVHGAGIATSVLQQWGSYNELRYVYNTFLANKGYLILDLDYRGSTGYGRDWRSDVYLHLGGKDLEDVLGAVDYLKSLGTIDIHRLGIWGVSYGGFMTNMALFQAPGVFKAGSSWAAVNDWENYNAGYSGQRLNTPAANPEAYRRSSPIHFSNNLKDNLLIIHGMVDNNVLFQDAVQLTEKLINEGKPFAHMFYPEESHGFIRDTTWIDALRRTTEWFDRYLQ